MDLKQFLSIGTIAMGLIGGGGQAQAMEFPEDTMSEQPLEVTQSSGSGGSTGGGTHSGVLGSVAPSGAKPDPSLGHKGPGNMDTSKGARQGSEIRPGDGGSNSPGSAGRSGSSSTGGSSGGSGAGGR
jgi:hypothetical protein